MSHGNDQLLWEYVFKPILRWFGITFHDDGSIIFWRWNRLTSFAYHKIHRIKSPITSYDHLSECKHCRDGFDKWRDNKIN